MQQRPIRRAGSRIKPFVVIVYDNVHMALWATLLAALIFLGAFGIPAMSAGRARYEAARAHQIEAEDAFYCRKWGMGAGSGKHLLCMTDLQQFRRGVEKRLADESDF